MTEQYCWTDVLTPDERFLAERAAGKRRDTGTRPALLMIDLYAKVFGDRPEPLRSAMERFPASCGLVAWDALEDLEALLDICRDSKLPISHSTGEDRADSHVDQARGKPRSQLSKDYAFHESVAPIEGEFVVRKSRPSAFFGTSLDTWLRKKEVDTLIVGGESTSGCVRATVVDAFSLGFHVIVCQDAVFDRSPLSHKISLFDMHMKYGTVLSLDGCVRYLEDVSADSISKCE